MKEKSQPFTITGRHVLFGMIVFFSLVIAVNVVFVRLAVGSFPGEEVEKSYYQGLNYNDVLAEKRLQDQSGWRLLLTDTRQKAGKTIFEIRLINQDKKASSQTTLRGDIIRPTTDKGHQPLVFTEQSDGIFHAEIPALATGAWDLTVSAANGDDVLVTATSRVIIE